LRHDSLDPARVIQRARVRLEAADRDAGHLRLGVGATHRVGVDHRQRQVRRCHEGLDRVVAADLQRHNGAEFPAVILLLHLHRAGDVAAIREAFLPDQRRTHVGADG
jgi:hypothetical protein